MAADRHAAVWAMAFALVLPNHQGIGPLGRVLVSSSSGNVRDERLLQAALFIWLASLDEYAVRCLRIIVW